MANETNGMAVLESAKIASNRAPAVGSEMPQPTTVHTPLASQSSASGMPMSQKVHQRATWPVTSFLRNIIGSSKLGQVGKQAMAASDVADDEELSADRIGPQFLPVLVAFGAVLGQISRLKSQA